MAAVIPLQQGSNECQISKIKLSCNLLSKEFGLEVNTEKAKYMLLSRHRNAG
jgi:hypothetical protein